MSQVFLTTIRRSDSPAEVGSGLDFPIEVRFGTERVLGPSSVSLGGPIDLSSLPPADRPIPSKLFNDYGTFQIFLHFTSPDDPSGPIYVLPLTPESDRVDALPTKPGERNLSTVDGSITYTVGYEVKSDFAGIQTALIVGIGTAIVTFVTSIVFLGISYVESLLIFLFQPFNRLSAQRKSNDDQ